MQSFFPHTSLSVFMFTVSAVSEVTETVLADDLYQDTTHSIRPSASDCQCRKYLSQRVLPEQRNGGGEVKFLNDCMVAYVHMSVCLSVIR